MDVDGMLDGLLPEQFNEWLAYREIEPDPWERLLMILRLGFCVVANAWGGKVEPKHIDPWLEKEPGTAASEEVSPNQAAAMVTTVLGVGR